jgi:hypothetical protein
LPDRCDRLSKQKTTTVVAPLPCSCPDTHSKLIKHKEVDLETDVSDAKTMLSQWPVQMKLVPINAPYFDGTDLLIATDCTAYAYGDFHATFTHNKREVLMRNTHI